MRSGFLKTSAPTKTVSVGFHGKDNPKLGGAQYTHVAEITDVASVTHSASSACQQLDEDPSATAPSLEAPVPLCPAVAAAQPLVTEVDPITWQRNFDQCLLLLKGPEDEKRFVGLLLVTKLLPKGGQKSVQSVHDALGMTFVSRLLLPITRAAQAHASGASFQHQTPPTQQQQLSVSLGLTILSALCRLPEVCWSPELLQLLPACVLVAVAGGVGAALHPSASTSNSVHTQPPAEADPAQKAEVESVADALECLLAVAGSSSDPTASPDVDPSPVSCGARAVLEAGGLQAAVAAAGVAVAASLAVAKVAPEAVPPAPAATVDPSSRIPSDGGEREGAASQRVALLALQLAGSLLQPVSCGALDLDLKSEVMAERYCQLQPLICVLGVLVGQGPRLAPTPPPLPVAEGTQPEKVKIVSSPVDGLDAAVLQLEALHTLLLLLPLSEDCPSYTRICMEATLCSSNCNSSKSRTTTKEENMESALSSWPNSVRSGINQMLRSRLPGPQRHSVLRLAACMVELAGAGWLLPRGGVDQGSGVSSSPGALLAVMVETLSVETELLLYDALHPDAPLLQPSSLRTATRPHHTPIEPSAALITALEERAEALPMEVMAAEAEAVDAASSAAAAGASANVTLASITSSSAHATSHLPATAAKDSMASQSVKHTELGEAVRAQAVAVAGASSDMDLDLTGGMKFESRQTAEIPVPPPADSVPAAAAALDAAVKIGSAASAQLPGDSPRVSTDLETSGLRAATMLPACYSLIEASIEALAQDSALDAEEDLAGLHLDSDSDASADDQDSGSGQMARRALGPVLGAEEARKLMPALGRSVESLLQFVETVAQQVRTLHRRQQQQSHLQEQGNSASPDKAPPSTSSDVKVELGGPDEEDEDEGVEVAGDDPSIWFNSSSSPADAQSASDSARPLLTELQSNLCLGATRVIGRFLAEVPQEASSGIFLRLLPTLLSLPVRDITSPGATCSAGTIGAVSSVSPPPSSPESVCLSGIPSTVTAAVADGQSYSRSGQQQQDLSPSWAVRFLIPGLLQATEGSSAESTAVADRICASKSALTCLASFLAACAREAVTTLHTLSKTEVHGATFPEQFQRQIATQEQAVADAAVLLLATLMRPGGSSASRPTGPAGSGPGSSRSSSSNPAPQPSPQLSDGEVSELMQQPMQEASKWLALRCGMFAELQLHQQQVITSITSPASSASCLVSMAQHTLLPRPLLATACLLSSVLAKVVSSAQASSPETLVSSYMTEHHADSSESSSSSSSSSGGAGVGSSAGCFRSLIWAMQTGCVLWSAELAESNDSEAWDTTLASQLHKQTQQQVSKPQVSQLQHSMSLDEETSALPASVLMNEFPGDAEDCWRRLMAIQGATLLPRLPSLRSAALCLQWVQQLSDSKASVAVGGSRSNGAQGKARKRVVTSADRELLCEAGVSEWLDSLDTQAV